MCAAHLLALDAISAEDLSFSFAGGGGAAAVCTVGRDREEGASYQLRDVPKFEGSYAEAEIGKVAGGKEKRMVLPFIWEDGKWRVAAAYRDGRSWDGEDF